MAAKKRSTWRTYERGANSGAVDLQDYVLGLHVSATFVGTREAFVERGLVPADVQWPRPRGRLDHADLTITGLCDGRYRVHLAGEAAARRDRAFRTFLDRVVYQPDAAARANSGEASS